MAVRRERVELDLETNFPRKAAEAAAAVRLLNEEIEHLSKRSTTSRRSTKDAADGIDDLARRAQGGGRSIDRYSGRLSLLAQVASTLGPSLVPIGAAGIPALTGLASAFGFAALGAGTAIGAFQGVGDALKALEKARLDPTVENLNAAKAAMQNISLRRLASW